MLRHEKCFHNVLCLSEAKGMDIKMNISLLEPIGISQTMIEDFSKGLKEAGHSFTYYDTKTTDVEELKRRSAGQDIVMIANTPYPDEVVRACDSLKMIAVAFTGIVHVGLEACKEKGIMICNCAGYSDTSVSELVLGMTINVMRNISACDTSVRSGKTSLGLAGTEIEGKTIGIIDRGQIGFQTAKLFLAFGAKVLAYARHEREEVKELGVDNQALTKALNEDKLAGAAIDVFDMEPPIPEDYPLLHAKNTLLTPHVAFLTRESMVRRARTEFDNVCAYLDGKPANVCRY